MKLKYGMSILAAVLLMTGLAFTSSAHDPSKHGFKLVTFSRPSATPVFSLMDLSGKQVSLEQYRGKYVLLNFWATWCPPCLEEMPSMDALYTQFRDRGFEVVAISSDKEGAGIVQGFVDKLGVEFMILLDPDGSVSASYGAKNLPVSFLLNRQGKVVAAAQGSRDWASSEAQSVIGEIIQAQ
jgi:peroxiredoxin